MTTQLLLGYAEIVETEAPESSLGIVVTVPTRELETALTIPAGGPLHVALSVEAGRIAYRISASPFGYM